MKIDTNNPYTPPSQNAITNQNPLTQHGGTNAEKDPVSAGKPDSITISGAALLVDSASRANDAEPAFDIDRVAALKNSINAGNYAINPEQLAEKFHQFTMRLQ